MRSGEPPRPEDGASSVADEAARLAETFAAWARTTGGRSGDRTAEPPAADPEPTRPAGCGCAAGGVETVCRVCPVCRLAGLVDAIQPELIDKVADLLGMVASSLHEVAADRRGAPGRTDDAGEASPADVTPPVGGIEIPVTDGEDD
ncbi:hypothetical protein [Flexivirga meconopsidis]|uniref:hypothetical protein n=1 Tax=Flexivirga meconopsidis TaxID=2977121 RepID=UPI00223FFD18|nr:hypothetical protein [Flexivirga meconopsidis]